MLTKARASLRPRSKTSRRRVQQLSSELAMRFQPSFRELTRIRSLPVDLRSGGHIVPSSVTTTFNYFESFSLAPGIPFSDYQFNLNSIFDPNRTGTGHQPLGHDQWSAFYGRYRVLGVDVRLSVQNDGAALINGALVANNTTTTFSDATAYEEEFVKRYSVGSSDGVDLSEVTTSINLAKVVGRSQSQYDSDDPYAAQFGASPTEVIILHVVNAANSGNITFNFAINLTFHTILYDRVNLALS